MIRDDTRYECSISGAKISPDLKTVHLDTDIAAWLDANIAYTPTLRMGHGFLIGFRTEADMILFKLSQ